MSESEVPNYSTTETTIRSTLKRTLETALVRSGVARIARAWSRSRAVILGYHNIVPEDAPIRGDRSLHLPRARFREQLEHLLRTHEVVRLPDLLDRSCRGTRRPLAAITFDDAYRGCVVLGVEELARRGLPATIFVAPALVGDRSFWWDVLADPEVGLPPELRRWALGELTGSDGEIRAWARKTRYRAHETDRWARSASEAELHAAVAHPGITLGSHSFTHRNLTRLSRRELIEELVRSLEWLRARFGSAIPFFAYPYGLSSPEVESAVGAMGYRGAVSVGGRWPANGRPNPFALPRQSVPSGLSAEGLALRLMGWPTRKPAG